MSDGELRRIQIAPGINRNETEYQAEGAWVSADKTRFHGEVAEKLGGWVEKGTDGTYYWGVARAIHPWATLDGSKLVALGTHNSLWLEEGGMWEDITPVRSSVVAASAFSGVSGSNVVNVSITAHGAQVNDLVYIGTSTELNDGGQSVSVGLYRVASAGADHFDVSIPEAATSTFTADGAVSTSFQFLITAGLKSNGALFGWGSDGWGEGTWGTAGTGGVATKIRQWTLANWGEDLLAQQKGGALYYRETSAGGRATEVAGAPTRSNVMFLSQDSRQVVLCGTSTQGGDFDPMLVRWSDIENYAEFTAAVTNAAGDYRIPIGSEIVGQIDAKKEHVIFTDEGAYTMTFRGAPDFFTFDRLGGNCGMVGMNAGVDLNGIIYWMAAGNFYVYDGTVKQLPSSLDEALFSETHPYRLNLEQKEKVFCGVNTQFSEIWWLYPAGANEENSRYVIYNYASGVWYDGNIVRTTWTGSKLFNTPLATNDASIGHSYFEHETGYNDDQSPMGSFLKSGEMQIGDGDDMMFVNQYVPDYTQNVPIKVIFNYKKYPQTAEQFTKGPYTITGTTGKKSIRLRGRSMNMQIMCTIANAYWRRGQDRIRMQPDGKR